MQGVSTRRVEELVQALGLSGISKSQVSVLCAELDGEVERFRTRPLTTASYPVCLAGCDLCQSADQWPCGQSSGGDCHWAQCSDGQPGSAGVWMWDPAKMAPSGWRFCADWSLVGWPGSSWWSVTRTKDSRAPLRRCCMEPGGNAVGCISCAMPSHWCAQSPRPSGGRDHPHGVCPAGTRDGSAELAPGRRWLPLPLSQAGCPAG